MQNDKRQKQAVFFEVSLFIVSPSGAGCLVEIRVAAMMRCGTGCPVAALMRCGTECQRCIVPALPRRYASVISVAVTALLRCRVDVFRYLTATLHF